MLAFEKSAELDTGSASVVGDRDDLVEYLVFRQIRQSRMPHHRILVTYRYALQFLDHGDELVDPLREGDILPGLIGELQLRHSIPDVEHGLRDLAFAGEEIDDDDAR